MDVQDSRLIKRPQLKCSVAQFFNKLKNWAISLCFFLARSNRVSWYLHDEVGLTAERFANSISGWAGNTRAQGTGSFRFELWGCGGFDPPWISRHKTIEFWQVSQIHHQGKAALCNCASLISVPAVKLLKVNQRQTTFTGLSSKITNYTHICL